MVTRKLGAGVNKITVVQKYGKQSLKVMCLDLSWMHKRCGDVFSMDFNIITFTLCAWVSFSELQMSVKDLMDIDSCWNITSWQINC